MRSCVDVEKRIQSADRVTEASLLHHSLINPLYISIAFINQRNNMAGDNLRTGQDGVLDAQMVSGIALTALLQDIGYTSCMSPNILLKLLEQIGITRSNASARLKEEELARVLGMMARTHTGLIPNPAFQHITPALFERIDPEELKRKQTWDAEVLMAIVLDLKPNLDWYSIMRNLDHPDFMLFDAAGFSLVLNAVKVGIPNLFQFPINAFFGRWRNIKGQLSFLKQAIQHRPELFVVTQSLGRRVIDTPTMTSLVNQPWNSLDLLETLLALSESEMYEEVERIFDFASQQAPEVILLGLAELKPPWTPLQKDLVLNLVMSFLSGGHSNSVFVLSKLWQVSDSSVITGLQRMYVADPTTLSRILDVAQDIKALPQILESKPYSFSIDLAALASRRDYLNLEKWLTDHIRDEGDVFIKSCVDFLYEKVLRQDNFSVQQSVPLSQDTVSIFLRILQNHMNAMPADTEERWKEIMTAFARTPHMMNMAATTNADGEDGGMREGGSFSADVEEEVNAYYERIYQGEISIPQIVELLQRLKASPNQREQDIYSCIIHNLFDEYKFFPRYPDNYLAITSMLFGALIQHQIVSYMPLGIALRYVLDALRQPVGSKLFRFGIQALSQFQARLSEWPQYCTHLLQIPHLVQVHPEIVQYIRSLQENQAAGTATTASEPVAAIGAGPSSVSESLTSLSSSVFTALKVDTLINISLVEPSEVPDEVVQDKILFIINNISPANLEAKIREIREIMREEHHKWFSNYIVEKRVSIEPNFHSLYISFLDALESPVLYRFLLIETFLSIRNLLNSEKTVTSSQERTLLKNLGTWLGFITLAKNKPIKHKHLSFKDLLVEGFEHNRLIVVIPFVCKVLEQANHSKVFKPPNPWLMAIMKLLAELYHFADLKLNLKFEIEVLCKNIKLDVKEIQPTTILRNRPPKETAPAIRELDRGSANAVAALGSAGAPAHGMSQSTPGVADKVLAYNLAAELIINPNLPLFATQPGLKRFIHIAIERAIREIIVPVVERSVTIAAIATKELIIKDFALEPNEEKMRKAAHLMVQSLAGSLAAVTCREPLRLSMVANTKGLLLQNGFTEQTLPEQAIFVIVNDNMDLACSIIERTAAEKALPEVDEGLRESYIGRRKHRERTGAPYYDMSVYAASRYPSTLPETLRLKAGGLTMQQLRVYEDFARMSRIMQVGSNIQDAADRQHSAVTGHVEMVRREARPEVMPPTYGTPLPPYEETPVLLTTQQVFEKFNASIIELEKFAGSQSVAMTLASLPPQHELRTALKAVPSLVTQAYQREEAALLFSQRVVQLLYKTESNLAREMYIVLLERLFELSKTAAKEVNAWLLYADEERKYNVPVTAALIRSHLVNVPEMDMQLARLMDIGRTSVVEFTAWLIKKCVLEEPPISSQNDFFNSIEILTKIASRGKAPDIVNQVLQEVRLRSSAIAIRDLMGKDNESSGVRDQLASLFTEWVRLYHHPASNEKSHLRFITQLQQQGVLKTEDVSSLFFRVCTELSVEAYMKAPAGTPSVVAFQAVDAFARLIVLVVRHYNDLSAQNVNYAKLTLTTKILSITVLVLVHSHEQRKTTFNQRPFFRLLSSLLNDLHSFEPHLQPIYFQILSYLSNTFHTLQPSFLPGFTFSWLQLVSHRFFMPKLLLAENQKGWPFFQRLLVDLFKFLAPFLRQSELTDTVRLLYKGTIRVLLVLLHDFPEFLCDYHFSFVDVIPHSCTQLRNLILSAFPRNMRLPDPFTPNLKVDLLPEINQAPHVLSDYTSAMMVNNLKTDTDSYLRNRAPAALLSDIAGRLMAAPGTLVDGSRYLISTINSLVLYVGIQAIAQSKSAQSGPPAVTHGASMDIFKHLVSDLDVEGRYLFLSGIANQLRYPNSHTHYFSNVLLYLFLEADQEIVQEQITRVLIERLIVNRPHPYGLLITFIELIRNPRYGFWNHTNFIQCAPEIDRLFTNVAKSLATQS
ncbi:hypothetical protein SeLEV6574_g06049 [Synchytrium endobioticum]|uniref:General negative regulator of transcription subunit 1 n=1 Tax=Synchytrium endobioticum TaxID=286115 RepID=A0A507CR50_9FUNG|nr:hypothetical protein SeLEV6574_g06049 [Synchytrium endobioticum]